MSREQLIGLIQSDAKFMDERDDIAGKHGLETAVLQNFVDTILRRMIFDGEQLSDLLDPQGLGWKARTHTERTGADGRPDSAVA